MTVSAAPGRKASLDLFAVAMMVFLTMTWGFNAVTSKVAVAGLDAMLVSFLRAVLASLALLAWCRWRGMPVFRRDGSLRPGMLAGLLFGLEFACIYGGLVHTSASRGNLMVNTMPFFALLASHVLLGEKATPAKIAGTVLAFAGVYVVFRDELSLPSETAIRGDLLCLMGAVFWAATGVVIRRSRLATIRPEKTLLYQLAGSAVVAAAFMPFGGPLVTDANPLVIASVLFQAFFVVAFTYTLWFWLMTLYPLSGLSSFAFLTTIFGVVFSALLLGDPLTPGLLTGLALVVAGLILANGTIRRRQPAP